MTQKNPERTLLIMEFGSQDSTGEEENITRPLRLLTCENLVKKNDRTSNLRIWLLNVRSLFAAVKLDNAIKGMKRMKIDLLG